MKLAGVHFGRMEIPFRLSFKHASAERRDTESVWVEAVSADGDRGYGESCPRSYVTGETLETAREFFLGARESLLRDVGCVASLRHWMKSHGSVIDENPAAWCAVELALLDLLARKQRQSVEAALGLAELRGPFQYTAVLGDMDRESFRSLFLRYWSTGFRDYKLKLSGELERDRDRIGWLRPYTEAGLRLRVDANNLWRSVYQATSYLVALDFPFSAVEEPLRPGEYEALAELADRLETPVILDESLLRAEQLERLPGPAHRWIVNLRVSKMGGLVRTLEVLESARRRGLRVIVGAQVGETSVLTRAALTVASRAGDALLAQEGAFGSLLLQHDVCETPLMFGPGGVLPAPDPPGPGLGLEVRRPLPFVRPMDAPGSLGV